MDPIKITRKISKRTVVKMAVVFYLIVSAGYGNYTGAINAYNWGQLQIDKFVVTRALDKNLVDKAIVVEQIPVIDPGAAAEVVSNAAKEGAKAGADASIKANLGK